MNLKEKFLEGLIWTPEQTNLLGNSNESPELILNTNFHPGLTRSGWEAYLSDEPYRLATIPEIYLAIKAGKLPKSQDRPVITSAPIITSTIVIHHELWDKVTIDPRKRDLIFDNPRIYNNFIEHILDNHPDLIRGLLDTTDPVEVIHANWKKYYLTDDRQENNIYFHTLGADDLSNRIRVVTLQAGNNRGISLVSNFNDYAGNAYLVKK